jgi:hypothetical protein
LVEESLSDLREKQVHIDEKAAGSVIDVFIEFARQWIDDQDRQ